MAFEEAMNCHSYILYYRKCIVTTWFILSSMQLQWIFRCHKLDKTWGHFSQGLSFDSWKLSWVRTLHYLITGCYLLHISLETSNMTGQSQLLGDCWFSVTTPIRVYYAITNLMYFSYYLLDVHVNVYNKVSDSAP